MKDASKLLPIGSIVLLKGGTKKLMIMGFYSSPSNDKDKVFDYCGCLYPEGLISSDKNLLFNQDQIDKIFYSGYKNEEEIEFKNNLNNLINNKE